MSCVTLNWCYGIDDTLDSYINQSMLKFYDDKRNELQDSKLLGVVSWNLYKFYKHDYRYLDDIFRISSNKYIFSNDESDVKKWVCDNVKLVDQDNAAKEAIKKSINWFVAGLDGERGKACAKRLYLIAQNDSFRNDVFTQLKQYYPNQINPDALLTVGKILFKLEVNESEKWKYIVPIFYNLNDREKEQFEKVINNNIADIAKLLYTDQKFLFSALCIYFGVDYGYVPSYERLLRDDILVIQNIIENSANNTEDICVFLQALNISHANERTPSGLDFLRIIANFNKLNIVDFVNKLFDAYHKFTEKADFYEKVYAIKNPVINGIIDKINQLKSYFNDESIILNENELPIVSNLLRGKISDILDFIPTMTGCKGPANLSQIINNLKIQYSFARPFEHYNGSTDNEISDQARKINDLMMSKCSNCRDCYLKSCLLRAVRVIMEDPQNTETIDVIWANHEERAKKCCDNELWKEILKLKKLLINRSYDILFVANYSIVENKITLYLANIYKLYQNNAGQGLFETFAHEIFRIYHASCVTNAGGNWVFQSHSNSKIVADSLASFFVYHYFDHCHLANRLFIEKWEKHSIKSWSYAGAKHLMPYDECWPINYSQFALFRYVFCESIKSLEDAVKMIEFGEKMEFEDF